jgi:hypothetical protein
MEVLQVDRKESLAYVRQDIISEGKLQRLCRPKPECVVEVVRFYENYFQEHGIEVLSVVERLHNQHIRIPGGEMAYGNVQLQVIVKLAYKGKECAASVIGPLVRVGKYCKKKWSVAVPLGFDDRMPLVELVKVVKHDKVG